MQPNAICCRSLRPKCGISRAVSPEGFDEKLVLSTNEAEMNHLLALVGL